MKTLLLIGILTILLGMFAMNSQAQIVNGNFEAGNTGFVSDYTYAPSGNTTEGQYDIRNNPANWNAAFFAMPDHTSGTGKMMVVNGATSGSPRIWNEIVSVLPNTTYTFSMWVSTAVNGGPASLILKVNDSPLGTPFTAPAFSGSWANMSQIWNSGLNTTADIGIINGNLSVFPNDFYIDDISFTAVVPAPEPTTLSLLAISTMGLLGVRRSKRKRF
jgi:hypothetical protein